MTSPAAVLVVGSYPPIPVPGAAASIAEVRRAWAEGLEVTVVAPRLSASHLTVPVYGLLSGRRLANVRRVTGADRLVLVVEDGYPLPAGPLPLQLASAETLVRALRGFRHVRIVQVEGVRLPAPVEARLRDAATEYVTVPGGPPSPGVTPLGPPETRARDRAARIAGRAAGRVLGRRATAARAGAGRARRRLKAALGRD